jgi:hypothetical protein
LRHRLFGWRFQFDLECRIRVCINEWDAVVHPIVDVTADVDLNDSTLSLQNGAEDIAFAVNNLVERLTDGGHGFG